MKSWAFLEAQKLADKYKNNPPAKGYVLFQTGYGPSGLPHIGTFGEVARTTFVRNAFAKLCPNIPTKLIAFSDDMDGLRKVPDNLPNQEMIEANLGKPLTDIPDPFGTHNSFGEHMNGRLQNFLDQYGFDYEFKSATSCYKSGLFDEALINVLQNYEDVINIVLPVLGQERKKTYSPFLPVCPDTGVVLQVPITAIDKAANTITYEHNGKQVTTVVTGGKTKLQWRVDWALRWYAFEVDYEMHGKDLTPSATLSSRICKALGKQPPTNYVYEMFLDKNGEKISKSKGNGISIEQWLTYATPESLSLYMYNNPRKAKRLHFDIIPKTVDEYLTWARKFTEQSPDEQLENPVWHIHNGTPPSIDFDISFGLLINLAAACNPESKEVLWGFIGNYMPGATADKYPLLDSLAGYAKQYYDDFVKPHKNYRKPTDTEVKALQELKQTLVDLPADIPTDEIQTAVFTVGKNHGYDNLRDWFKTLYEVLLGQQQGPRMGSFIKLYGVDKTVELVEGKLG